jgi:hypothetical protein
VRDRRVLSSRVGTQAKGLSRQYRRLETSSSNDGMNCVCIELPGLGSCLRVRSEERCHPAELKVPKRFVSKSTKAGRVRSRDAAGVVDTAHSRGQARLCSGAICDAQFAARTALSRNLQHDITETETAWALRAGS